MRKHNLISLIYENLEKTSAAVEKTSQTTPHPATSVHGCCCDRWGHPCIEHIAAHINRSQPATANVK